MRVVLNHLEVLVITQLRAPSHLVKVISELCSSQGWSLKTPKPPLESARRALCDGARGERRASRPIRVHRVVISPTEFAVRYK